MASKSMDRDFFKKDNIHGQMKRIMYKKFLQAYIPKTQNEKGRYSYKTIIIDAFAGAGRYGPQYEWPAEIEKHGSPLIALMVTLGFYHRKHKTPGEADDIWGWEGSYICPKTELRSVKKSYRMENVRFDDSCDIELIFIESNSMNYKDLTRHVEILLIRFIKMYYRKCRYGKVKYANETCFSLTDRPFSINVRVTNGSFETFDPPDLEANGVVSLTFLDPFGYTQTPMKNLQRYAPGKKNDILINFMSSYVNRQVKRNPKGVADLFGIGRKQSDEENEENLSTFVENVIRTSEKPEEVLPLKRARIIAENYEKYLKTKTGANYSLSFEMRKENNDILYHIIYITNHIEGVKSMKESMNRCSQIEDGMALSEYFILRKGQKINLGNMDNCEKVANTVYEYFKGQEHVSLSEITDFIWLHTPYLFRKKPLAKLEKDGKMSVKHSCQFNSERKRRLYTFPDKTKEGYDITYSVTFSPENVTSDHPKQSGVSPVVKKRKIDRLQKEKNVKRKMVMKRKEKKRTNANEEFGIKYKKIETDTRAIEGKAAKKKDKNRKKSFIHKTENKKTESEKSIDRKKERKETEERKESKKHLNEKGKLTVDKTSKERKVEKGNELKSSNGSKKYKFRKREIEDKLTSDKIFKKREKGRKRKKESDICIKTSHKKQNLG